MENCKLIIVYFFVVLILAITIIAQKDISHQQEMETSLDHIDSLENIIKLKEYNAPNIINSLPIGFPLDNIDISSPFGIRKNPLTKRWQRHQGVDLKGTYLDTVYATGEGVILHAGWCGGYGRCVTIFHGGPYETTYAHLNKVFVKEKDTVCDEQPIGTVGNTGHSTGQHLHYELSFRGKNIDPLPYITTKIP